MINFDIPFFPIEASTIAPQTDLLLVLLLSLSAFFTTIVVALIIYFSFKYRRGRPADRSNPPLANTKIELGWIGGLMVLALGTFSFATLIYYHINRPPANTLDIYVVAKQWMWKIQQPTGRQEIDSIHVPIDKPVRLIMISQDVIHSLYIPAFRLKFDVLPGRYTTLWFQATKTGEYHLFCAEYCGTNHSRMIGSVIVMPQNEYSDWLAGGATTAQNPPQGGEQLFTQFGCTSCHVAGAGVQAPSLNGLFGSTVNLSNGTTVVADENYIRESIMNPQAKIVAGFTPIMPTYQGRISEDQILQLIAYIKSLGSQPGSGGTPAPSGGNATPLSPSAFPTAQP